VITGSVTPEKEARVSLAVRGPNGSDIRVSAVIDTGFNGSLTLPLSVIVKLGLARRAPRQATLADGSVVILEV
jgi:predicted aspartyl protease